LQPPIRIEEKDVNNIAEVLKKGAIEE